MAFPAWPIPSNWLTVVSTYHAYAYGIPDTAAIYSFTGDISANTSTQWNAITWMDVRPQPTYAVLSDPAFVQEALNAMSGYLSSIFEPTDHAQIATSASDISTLQSSVSSLSASVGSSVQNTRTVNGHALSSDVTVTKSDVGLSNVDNTSDASKTFTSSQITDMAEAVQDMASTFMVASGGLSSSYNDGANTFTFTAPRTSSTLSLSLVGTGATGTQISSTKDSTIRCNVSTSTTSTIGGPSTSVVSLKTCATNSATEGDWTTIGIIENDQTITLAVALSSIQLVKGQLCADVPAGYYAKLVNSGSGTHSETFVSGQKTIYG